MAATRAKRRQRIRILVIVLCLLGILVLTGLDQRLQVRHYDLSFPGLPDGFSGETYCVIADPHGSYMAGGENDLLSAIREEAPGAVFLLGDLLMEDDPDFDGLSDFLSVLVKIAPVYSVSGNHDRWEGFYKQYLTCLQNAGVICLEDGETTLTRGGDSIHLVGFADPPFWTNEPKTEQIAATVSKLPAGDGFDILLYHRANFFDAVAGKGYDLVLSGHLHGGIVRLPFIGPLFRELPVGEMTYAGGKYDKDGTVLVSCRGLGNNVWVPRVFNRPELVAITLKKGEMN